MKKIIIILIVIFATTLGYSQKIIDKIESTRNIDKLELDFDFADEIKISCWNKEEISIHASISINNNENNDVYSLEFETIGSKLLVFSKYDDLEKVGKENITIKKDKEGHTISINNGWNVDIDAYYEIKMPKNLDIKVETISGDIVITDHLAEMDLNSISGIIDVKVDESAEASIEVETITGAVYTNHIYKKPEFSLDGLKYVFGGDVEFDLNGGGRHIHLETISGEVYIRK